MAENLFEDDIAGDVATRDARQRKHGCGEDCRGGTRSQEEEEAERKGTRVPAKGTWTRKTHLPRERKTTVVVVVVVDGSTNENQNEREKDGREERRWRRRRKRRGDVQMRD